MEIFEQVTPTPWQFGGMVFGLAVYAIAWTWGGRPERLGAGLLLMVTLLAEFTYRWQVEGFYPAGLAQDGVRLLVFGWLCFRLDRWWLFPMTAAHALIVLAFVLRYADPSLSQNALAAALVGLGYLVDLSLLLGVVERWLAGEPAAGPAAWARANRADRQSAA
ncbi:hypothetical protein [Brevundimonas sp.]|uniref:hypothetical protein n=1 Tax=Brevundimonas sp. TaxID=1871086 RepID=UPI002FC9DD66